MLCNWSCFFFQCKVSQLVAFQGLPRMEKKTKIRQLSSIVKVYTYPRWTNLSCVKGETCFWRCNCRVCESTTGTVVVQVLGWTTSPPFSPPPLRLQPGNDLKLSFYSKSFTSSITSIDNIFPSFESTSTHLVSCRSQQTQTVKFVFFLRRRGMVASVGEAWSLAYARHGC